jgi:hypothetical protein
MCCGAPATRVVPRLFTWRRRLEIGVIGELLGALVLLWDLVVGLMGLVICRHMVVPTQLCAQHRNYWRRRPLLIWGGLLLVSVGYLVSHLLVEGLVDGVLARCLVAVAILLAVGWIFLVVILIHGGIRAAKITANHITLVNVSQAFADACDRVLGALPDSGYGGW